MGWGGGQYLSHTHAQGFEIGSGFSGTRLRGSQHNDAFEAHGDGAPLLKLRTNHGGGTLGGISSGFTAPPSCK